MLRLLTWLAADQRWKLQFLRFLPHDYPTLPDEALVINHIKEEINFDWGRLLEDLHRLAKTLTLTNPELPELEFLASGWTSTSLPQSLTRGVASSPTSGGPINQVLLLPVGPGPIKSCLFLRPCFLMMVVACSKYSNFLPKSINPRGKKRPCF